MAIIDHIMTQVPDRDVVFRDVQDFLRTASEALEDALAYSQNYFRQPDHPFDPYFFPAVVRYRVKTKLQLIDEIGDGDIESYPLSNMGLLVVFKNYAIRILKADEGRLPAPGASEQKRAFYCQQLHLPIGLKDPVAGAINLNLVLLWSDAADGSLLLTLTCPKFAAKSRESVVAHWYLPIDALVDLFNPEPSPEPMDDLDISLDNGQQGPIIQPELPFEQDDDAKDL